MLNYLRFFAAIGMTLMASLLLGQQTIVEWDFETLPAAPNAGSPDPSFGVGTASLVGSMSGADRATGSAAGCAQTTGNFAWQIGNANPGSNESSGVEFRFSTAGFENITFRFDHRFSNASTRTSRIQYTLDGITWINLDLNSGNYSSQCANRGGLDLGRIDVSDPVGNNAGDTWGRRTIDFSGISGAADNPNFGVRIVAAHYSTTGQFRQANNVNNMATAGTWRFDNIKVTGMPKKCVLITEYMYSGANGEFVEFTNVCQLPIDMSGWSFDDDSRTPGSFDLSAFGIVQPGESVILTEAPESAFRANWNLCPGVKIIGNLSGGNNLGRNDEINLYDANGNLVDRLTYGDQAFPGSIRTQNKSGWVSASGLGQNDPYAWTLAAIGDQEDSYASVGGDLGSPGKSSLAPVVFDPCDVGPCILITEYMYQGADGEFVEFTNICTFPINMSGWSFDDDSRVPGSFDLSGFGIVQPGESVILTENTASAFRAAWNLCDGVKVIGGLSGGNNLGRNDEINLYDADGNLVDRLTYGDQAFPGSIRTQNKSGWVSASGLGQNDPYAWTLAAIGDQEDSYASVGGDLGSPGKSSLAPVFYEPCVTPPCILITEYMYQGAPGEFVEFTNVCTEPVDMTGWSFDDDSRTPGSFDLSAFGIVQPGESVILTEADAETFRAAWGLCSEIKIIGGLSGGNNLGRNDEINLYDADGNLVDRLTYGDQNFPGSIRTQNASGWVTEAGLGQNNAFEWILSTIDDAEGSYANTSGIIGSPGKSTRASVVFDPCDEIEPPCLTLDEINITHETCEGAINGSVEILATGTGTLEFSIDGENFQLENNFTALSARSYLITIRLVEDQECSLVTNVLIRNSSPAVAPQVKELDIQPLSQIALGSTEVVTYDPTSKRVFSTNVSGGKIDIIDLSDPANPQLIGNIPVTGEINSVAVKNGIVAIAVAFGTDPGQVILTDIDGNLLLSEPITVGALPDMIVFTPDGNKILTANEGEPNNAYTIDPEGSISIIDISNGLSNYTVTTADFQAYIGQEDNLRAQGIRIFGPGSNAAQDFEPEYIAISDDGLFAYVTLQENNALAIVDIQASTVIDVKPLGFKDHSLPRNAFDPSDRDSGIEINTWPVFGMYQPDAIAWYVIDNQAYVITANEGDARVYSGFSEEVRVNNITLDPIRFLNASMLSQQANLGRLRITNQLGDADSNNKFEEIYAYGARSFSIWSASDGSLIYDSGSDFERITAVQIPDLYNSELGLTTEFDQRSDNKGPEPEAVAIAKINNQHYAFIGLERTGGFMVYNVSNPQIPHFVAYVGAQAGDAAPEDLKIISASESPTGKTLVLVANEASGTLSIYEVNADCSNIVHLDGNAQGGTGIYVSHEWQIVGGSAMGAELLNEDQAQAQLDLSGVVSPGDVEILYTVTDQNGCTATSVVIYTLLNGQMAVTGNSMEIANGSNEPMIQNHTNMGSTRANLVLTRTFTIHNTGCQPFEFSTNAVSISGSDADYFQVTTQPSGTLNPGDQTTFTIEFSAPDFGIYLADIVIESNAVNSPYTFTISAAVSPAVMVVRGNSVTIPNGSLQSNPANFTDFGTISWNNTRTRTFAIFNTGTQNLNLTGNPKVVILDDPSNVFEVTSQPQAVVTPSQNRQFQIRFTASAPGEYQATVSIENDDLGNNPYVFVISALVLPPDMEVRGNNQIIANGAQNPSPSNLTDFGIRAVNSNTTHTFTVRNNGPGFLGLIGNPRVEISGPGASHFTVTTQPVLSISPGNSSIFRIRFTPLNQGTHTATVSIANIDPDKNPYTFTITGSTPNAMPLHLNPMAIDGNSEPEEVSIYPNPSRNIIYVAVSGLESPIEKIEIFNYLGQIVFNTPVDSPQHRFEIADLIPGNYIIKVFTKNQIFSKTFVKID